MLHVIEWIVIIAGGALTLLIVGAALLYYGVDFFENLSFKMDMSQKKHEDECHKTVQPWILSSAGVKPYGKPLEGTCKYCASDWLDRRRMSRDTQRALAGIAVKRFSGFATCAEHTRLLGLRW